MNSSFTLEKARKNIDRANVEAKREINEAYVKMTEEKAKKVIADHIVNGNVVTEYTIGAVKE